jgi:membrane protein
MPEPTRAPAAPTPKSVMQIAVEAANGWIEDAAARLAAAISFTTIFSLAPMLILVVAVAGVFWGNQPDVVQGRLMAELRALVGEGGAEVVGTMLENAERPGGGGLLASILGIVTLLVGATALFAQLQDALNTIWGVKPSPRTNAIWAFVRQRLLSFGLILTVCFLLLVSLVISVVITALSDALGVQGVVLHLLNVVVSIGLITFLFALIYRYLPDARIAWRDVWVGALVTAVLFTLGKLGIGLYLGNSSTASTYGAAGSLVVLLLWIYYSVMILLYGAEVTQVYATRFGQGVIPNENAVRVVTETVEVEPQAVQHATKQQEKALVAQAAASLSPTGGARPYRKPSVLGRAAPLVAAFFAGRLTKRR